MEEHGAGLWAHLGLFSPSLRTLPFTPSLARRIPPVRTGSSRGGCLPYWDNDLNIAMAFRISVCSTSGVSCSRRVLAPLGGLLSTNLHYFAPL